jgi:hypothetical protein
LPLFRKRVARLAQDRVVATVLRTSRSVHPAALARLDRVPMLQPARVIGVGVRPEHVRTPAVARRGRAVA